MCSFNTCVWIMFICTTMFNVLTCCVPRFLQISPCKIWMKLHWKCYRNSQWTLHSKWVTFHSAMHLMVAYHSLRPGCCHAHWWATWVGESDSIWDRNLNANNYMRNSMFQQKRLILTISRIKILLFVAPTVCFPIGGTQIRLLSGRASSEWVTLLVSALSPPYLDWHSSNTLG